jgi:hypothetical protein
LLQLLMNLLISETNGEVEKNAFQVCNFIYWIKSNRKIEVETYLEILKLILLLKIVDTVSHVESHDANNPPFIVKKLNKVTWSYLGSLWLIMIFICRVFQDPRRRQVTHFHPTRSNSTRSVTVCCNYVDILGSIK